MAVQVDGEVLTCRGGYLWVQIEPRADSNPYPFNMYAEAARDKAGDNGLVLKIASTEQATQGDRVTLEARRPSQSLSALILLFIPLFATLVGIAIGMAIAPMLPLPPAVAPVALAVLGMAGSYLLIRRTNKRLETAEEFQPKLIKIHRKPPPSLPPGNYTSFDIEPVDASMPWEDVIKEMEGLVGVNGAVRSWDGRTFFVAHNPQVIKDKRLRELLLYLGVQLRETL